MEKKQHKVGGPKPPKRPRLTEYFWLAVAASVAMVLIGAAINPLAPIMLPKANVVKSPKAAGSADALNSSMVAGPTNTNYIIYNITNLPPEYGPAYGRKVFLNWSDDGIIWHEGGLLMHPGFNVMPTNKHRFYKFTNAPLPVVVSGPA